MKDALHPQCRVECFIFLHFALVVTYLCCCLSGQTAYCQCGLFEISVAQARGEHHIAGRIAKARHLYHGIIGRIGTGIPAGYGLTNKEDVLWRIQIAQGPIGEIADGKRMFSDSPCKLRVELVYIERNGGVPRCIAIGCIALCFGIHGCITDGEIIRGRIQGCKISEIHRPVGTRWNQAVDGVGIDSCFTSDETLLQRSIVGNEKTKTALSA